VKRYFENDIFEKTVFLEQNFHFDRKMKKTGRNYLAELCLVICGVVLGVALGCAFDGALDVAFDLKITFLHEQF